MRKKLISRATLITHIREVRDVVKFILFTEYLEVKREGGQGNGKVAAISFSSTEILVTCDMSRTKQISRAGRISYP
ncbi:MAG: hypothetical protein K0U86_02920 [Planctomycetes bacterium]|nr:hypothetical protein [Planctomycetota bacterium]MCH9723842.1 hypothetical protein [Planctomycetota bacterium]MCH9776253.1 hypothetical protein [Planctomycetota bacterium]